MIHAAEERLLSKLHVAIVIHRHTTHNLLCNALRREQDALKCQKVNVCEFGTLISHTNRLLMPAPMRLLTTYHLLLPPPLSELLCTMGYHVLTSTQPTTSCPPPHTTHHTGTTHTLHNTDSPSPSHPHPIVYVHTHVHCTF